jgi:hypothetical protein
MPHTANASAWNLEPAKAQFILTSAQSNADTLIDSDGQAVELTNFIKQDARFYMEFGLFESLMFVGQAGFQTIDFRGAGSDVDFRGFDETKLGLQYQFVRKEGLAGSVLLSYVMDGGLDDPRLNIGGRNDEVELRALYGRSHVLKRTENSEWIGFYDIQIGSRYDLKTDILSRWQLDLTAGLKPNEKWMGLAQIYLLDIEEQTINLFTTPAVKQAKAELSLAYRVTPNRYAQIGVSQTLTGRNIVKEKGLFFGLWQEF